MNFFRIIFFLLLVGLTNSYSASAQQAKKPNIVIILADDLGWADVGFHGSNIMTPNLDELAREGIILNRYYTTPVCTPTRAGLMTGRYPDRYGLRATVIPPWSDFGLDTSEVFISNMLQQAGYTHRAAIGKWHLGHAKRKFLPLQRGFSHFYGAYNGAFDYFTHKREGELDWHRGEEPSYDKGYATDLITDEAVKCIKEYSREEAPFFLYVAYNAPHGPLQAKKEDLLLYGYDEGRPSFGRNNGYGRGNTRRQTYSAMVTAMDRGIGAILSALKEAGVDENTLVLFHSDNGAAPGGGSSGKLKGRKFHEWDGGVRVPAIIKWPAGFDGGAKINQVTGYIDIMPTLREIVGITTAPSKPLDGISILPVLKGEKKRIDRDFYLGFGAIISGNEWKLVKANSGNPRMNAANDVLYNIVKDPSEKQDLKAQYPEIYNRLSERLAPFDAITSAVEAPPYEQGRQGFKVPKEWKITK